MYVGKSFCWWNKLWASKTEFPLMWRNLPCRICWKFIKRNYLDEHGKRGPREVSETKTERLPLVEFSRTLRFLVAQLWFYTFQWVTKKAKFGHFNRDMNFSCLRMKFSNWTFKISLYRQFCALASGKYILKWGFRHWLNMQIGYFPRNCFSRISSLCIHLECWYPYIVALFAHSIGLI